MKNGNYYFTYGLIVPLLVALLTVYIGRETPNNLWILDYNLSQATLALMLGVIISIFAYLIERYILKSESAYEKAILLGLLAAEIMVFINNEQKNTMATVTLLLFFYFHSVEH
jgi:uncharacterized membrane protein YadS